MDPSKKLRIAAPRRWLDLQLSELVKNKGVDEIPALDRYLADGRWIQGHGDVSRAYLAERSDKDCYFPVPFRGRQTRGAYVQHAFVTRDILHNPGQVRARAVFVE